MTNEEEKFLQDYDRAQYPALSVAVDAVLLEARADGLYVLMVQRAEHPFKTRWALPGTFVAPDETAADAATRALQSKAGVAGLWLEQLRTFDAVDRDPRTRVVSVAHLALVPPGVTDVSHPAAAWARVDVSWEGEAGGPADLVVGDRALPLAFDHAEIVGEAVRRLRGKLNYTNVAFALLPERFTLRELHRVHEVILGHELNKDAFRRKMLASDLVEATGELQEGVGHRPAEFYAHTGVAHPAKGRLSWPR